MFAFVSVVMAVLFVCCFDVFVLDLDWLFWIWLEGWNLVFLDFWFWLSICSLLCYCWVCDLLVDLVYCCLFACGLLIYWLFVLCLFGFTVCLIMFGYVLCGLLFGCWFFGEGGLFSLVIWLGCSVFVIVVVCLGVTLLFLCWLLCLIAL